jgi:hypothetical protein
MQRNDIALKRRVYIDGDEWADLVGTSKLGLEKDTIQVPEFSRIHETQNGVSKMPPIDLQYKVSKGSSTYERALNWYQQDETHDVVIFDCDASGAKVRQWLAMACECSAFDEEDYKAEAPGYYKVTIKILPYDLKPTKV